VNPLPTVIMTETDDHRIEWKRLQVMNHLLPVIILMAFMAFIGLLGNLVAVVFYARHTKRTTTVVFITYLAVADICVCAMIIPNILEMAYNIQHNQSFLCKLTHFLGLVTVGSSCLTLMLIAMDRHQKICTPFKKQFTLKTAKYATLGCVVFAVVVSLRNFIIFDAIDVHFTEEARNETLDGTYCTQDDDPKYSGVVTAFNIIDFLLMLIIWIVLIGCYSRIVYTVLKIQKKRRRMQQNELSALSEVHNPSPIVSSGVHTDPESEGQTNESILDSEDDTQGESNTDNNAVDNAVKADQDIQRESLTIKDDEANQNRSKVTDNDIRTSLHVHFQTNLEDHPTLKSDFHEIAAENESDESSFQSDVSFSTQSSTSTSTPSGRRKRRKKHHLSAKERRLTYMMLTVTVIYILCFLPYFVVRIVARIVLETGREFEIDVVRQIAIRLPYLNSVVNPIIYCIFNKEFRQYALTLTKRLIQLRHKITRSNT